TGLLAFSAAWNEFLFALTLTLDRARTVPVVISQISGASQHELPWGVVMAASVVVTVPLIVLVLLLQRRIVAGLAPRAVKGEQRCLLVELIPSPQRRPASSSSWPTQQLHLGGSVELDHRGPGVHRAAHRQYGSAADRRRRTASGPVSPTPERYFWTRQHAKGSCRASRGPSRRPSSGTIG